MKTLVVAGSHSGVGKTTLARFICGLVPGSVRVKIGHGAARPDDDGYFYHQGTPFGTIAAACAAASLVVIESNSILNEILPDCTVFLTGGNPKPSAAAALRAADIVRGRRVDAAAAYRIGSRLGLDISVVRKIAWLAGARPVPVTGIVLAGGKSRRMGTDKTLMEIGGIPMALRSRAALAPYCDDVILSVNHSNAANFAGYATVVDAIDGDGPLRGIASGLDASSSDINIIVACDIPHIDPPVLCTLFSHCDDADIVVPSFAPGMQEPLYGVYRKNVAPLAMEILGNGRRRVAELFGKCRTKIVPVDDGGRYVNLNTRGDIEKYANNYIPRPLLHHGEGENGAAEICSSRMNRTSGVTALQYVYEAKKQRARSFRRNATDAEKILWSHLRNRKTAGLKFRRQQIIDGFIADFYCEESRLVVEVDGNIHDTTEQKALDIYREKVFADRGIFTLRIRNESVVNNIDHCLLEIISVSRKRMQ